MTAELVDRAAQALYAERWGIGWSGELHVVVKDAMRRQAAAVIAVVEPELTTRTIDHIALVEAVAKAVDHEYGDGASEGEAGCLDCMAPGWPCQYVTRIVDAVENVVAAGMHQTAANRNDEE